jgi:hypothetical protein
MRKLAPSKMVDGAKCIFVNFIYENDYNHILSKFLSLYQYMPSTLQILILSLEPGASKVNTEFAEHFQRLMQFKFNIKCHVFFIKYEDKQKILSQMTMSKDESNRVDNL